MLRVVHDPSPRSGISPVFQRGVAMVGYGVL